MFPVTLLSVITASNPCVWIIHNVRAVLLKPWSYNVMIGTYLYLWISKKKSDLHYISLSKREIHILISWKGHQHELTHLMCKLILQETKLKIIHNPELHLHIGHERSTISITYTDTDARAFVLWSTLLTCKLQMLEPKESSYTKTQHVNP